MHGADQPDDMLAAKNQRAFILPAPERQGIIAQQGRSDV